MTDEAHGDNSEDTPVRPTSTRWSDDASRDDAVQEEDSLAPPYVPGRRTRTAASTPPTSTTTGSEAGTSAPPTSASTSTTSEDDFPFDQFDIGGDADTAAPESPVGDEHPGADEPGVAEELGSEADEMVWSPADLGDGEEPYEQQAETIYTEEAYDEWSPGYGDDDDASAVDAELEPITDEPPVEEVEAAEVEGAEFEDAEDEPEHRFEPDGTIETEPAAAPAVERAEQVAAVLDRLAGLLRDEGEEAVRREMQSQDRLTALVSSLLVGHLSARQ